MVSARQEEEVKISDGRKEVQVRTTARVILRICTL
jgi:hypothetical protein